MWPPATSAMFSCGWLCVLLAAATADSTVYGKVGDDVVLKPFTASTTITGITWREGNNLAAEWSGEGDVSYYRHFKVRGSLNISTGELTIKSLTLNDSMTYTAEVNGKTEDRKIHLFVISAVPVPTIVESCNNETCKLTCDGDVKGAGSVTYSWKPDDKVETKTPEKLITKEGSLGIKEFSCGLKNQVSQATSESIPNPFLKPPKSAESGGNLKIALGATVFISLLTAVLMLVFIHRCKAGMWFFDKDSMPWEADFWKHERPTAPERTTARQEKGKADEETLIT